MKIALVTGGNRGLGKSAALHLAAKKVGVIITYRSHEEEASRVVRQIQQEGGTASALKLDVGKTAEFSDFITQLHSCLSQDFASDGIDYLLNNAGVGINTAIDQFQEEDFDQLVNVHFKGPFFLTQKLLPLMREGGRVLNVSSGLSRFSMPGYSVYGSLKGAMDVMTRYMALEFSSKNIAVNIIAPGAIETDFRGGEVRDTAPLNQALAQQTALGRVGLPDDIGGIMAELLAGPTHWINGQRIEASGGFRL